MQPITRVSAVETSAMISELMKAPPNFSAQKSR